MRTKLSPEQIAQIRKRYAKGTETQWQLAQEFGVHPGHVSRIVNHQTRAAEGPTAGEVFQRIYANASR